MKLNLTITKLLVVMIGLTLTSCSTWHYNNPRVSVDKAKVIYTEPMGDTPSEMSAIQEDKVIEESKAEVKTTAQTNTLTSRTTKVDLVKTIKPTTPVVVKSNIKKSKSSFEILMDHFKKRSDKVNKTKQVEKTQLSGWVRIMIILFIVGFVLLLIGIFLSVFIYGGFWWLFYGFGALCILAGFVVLILGLVGLI